MWYALHTHTQRTLVAVAVAVAVAIVVLVLIVDACDADPMLTLPINTILN